MKCLQCFSDKPRSLFGPLSYGRPVICAACKLKNAIARESERENRFEERAIRPAEKRKSLGDEARTRARRRIEDLHDLFALGLTADDYDV